MIDAAMMYLGFDSGKRWQEAALLDADGRVVRPLRFAPTRAGLQQLATWPADVMPTAVQIGLEATGVYRLPLHAWLRQWGAPATAIRVLDPLQTRAFRHASRRGVKTDRADAVAIARRRGCPAVHRLFSRGRAPRGLRSYVSPSLVLDAGRGTRARAADTDRSRSASHRALVIPSSRQRPSRAAGPARQRPRAV